MNEQLGRPQKRENTKGTKPLTIIVSHQVWSLCFNYAHDDRVSLGAWVRKLINQELARRVLGAKQETSIELGT